VQAVLGLVEPQSSGIGGGAFLLHHDRESGRTTFFDGRETAPAGQRPDAFQQPDGQALGYFEGARTGVATGVPGVVAMLGLAQAEHGRLPWSTLFDAPIRLAEQGWAVGPRLNMLLGRVAAVTDLEDDPDVRAMFFDARGQALPPGTLVRNPAYARTLRTIARDGADAFLRGEIGAGILAAAARGPRPSVLTAEDLAAYRPVVREPQCAPFRQWRVCSAPPPSSGIAVLQILALFDAAGTPPVPASAQSAEAAGVWERFINASLLAYADRDYWVADPDFVEVPDLLHPPYINVRSALMNPTAASRAAPGDPAAFGAAGPRLGVWAGDRSPLVEGTSHFVIIDAWGDVVSMTTTVEGPFGSGRMTGGFFLNNQLTDFAKAASGEARAFANIPEPGKRPRSSMSPTIVFDAAGEPVLAVGSPGGNAIIAYVAKTLVGVLHFGLTPQQAIDLPNIIARGGVVSVESARMDPGLLAALRARGYTVREGQGEQSGIHAVRIVPGGFLGGADPRREGVAREGRLAAPTTAPAR
jgi:gamma-glutamyltranspeptidase/glutathione hydrolase